MHDIVVQDVDKCWILAQRYGCVLSWSHTSAKAGAKAALLGKLRRLDPAISTEEQYMVDVSWRQDVLKFLEFPKNANSDLQSCSCTLLFFCPCRRWTNYSNLWRHPEPHPPKLQCQLYFPKHSHGYTKSIKPRRTNMKTWDGNIEIQGVRGNLYIMHLGFDLVCPSTVGPAFRVTWRAKLWQKIFASQRSTTALRWGWQQLDRQWIN